MEFHKLQWKKDKDALNRINLSREQGKDFSSILRG